MNHLTKERLPYLLMHACNAIWIASLFVFGAASIPTLFFVLWALADAAFIVREVQRYRKFTVNLLVYALVFLFAVACTILGLVG